MANKLKTYETDFVIQQLTKGKTDRNQTFYDIQVLNNLTGEVLNAFYFGNTKPKVVLAVESKISRAGEPYNIATIQPHQSRNRLGRFTSTYRRT